MVPKAFITEWRAIAPWYNDTMVEQDLIINKSVVEIFSHPLLANNLAFRGGTALHKIFMHPGARYSEDIDLVQTIAGPIGPIFDALHEQLTSWLGKPQRKQGEGIVTLTYKVQSEENPSTVLKLKIEINSREHFSVLGIQKKNFIVNSRWYVGKCEISTFQLEELLGTKMRALYQRRKGRDLFDLWLALTECNASPHLIVKCFKGYMERAGLKVSSKEYLLNMGGKMQHPGFINDTEYLIRNDISYSPEKAYQLFKEKILAIF